MFLARHSLQSTTAGILLVAAAAIGIGLTGCKDQASPGTKPEALNGRWQRPDGGYVLEIGNATGSGAIEAAYLNPQPIHVAKAELAQTNGQWEVFVELRDVNYPGSTYRLAYDPSDDRLKGEYYQAVTKQTFPIFFVRVKP